MPARKLVRRKWGSIHLSFGIAFVWYGPVWHSVSAWLLPDSLTLGHSGLYFEQLARRGLMQRVGTAYCCA